jgi:hypothetical protein
MHTVTISLQGAANDSASVKLKEVLTGGKPTRRGGRKEATPGTETQPAAETAEEA